MLRNLKTKITNLVLATNIPDSEANVIIFHSLHIETWEKMQISITSQSLSDKRNGKIIRSPQSNKWESTELDHI